MGMRVYPYGSPETAVVLVVYDIICSPHLYKYLADIHGN